MFNFLTKKTGIINDNDPSLAGRLKQTLKRTNLALTDGLLSLIGNKKKIDDDLLEALETQLLIADVGIEATKQMVDDLKRQLSRQQLKDGDALFSALREQMIATPKTELQALSYTKR